MSNERSSSALHQRIKVLIASALTKIHPGADRDPPLPARVIKVEEPLLKAGKVLDSSKVVNSVPYTIADCFA